MAQREVRGAEAKARDGGGAGRRHHVDLEMGGGGGGERAEGETWACGAAAAGIAAVGLAGAGVLVWWAVAFHPTHEQLWMVPVGLVLLGTPLLAWLSLFASGACRWVGRLRDGADQPPVSPAVAPER
ncbi:hypothetical protein ACP70R_013106 [Stipagrostis hirtigluma subsp. patula]